MNQLTKQELQTALQQIANTICAKTASQQDVVGAMQAVVPRICTKHEIQAILDANREKMAERLALSFRDQQNLLRHLAAQFDEINRRIAGVEVRLNNLQAILENSQHFIENFTHNVREYNNVRGGYREVYLA